MNNLLFLTNELLDPTLISSMQLPIQFVAFGIVKGNLYHHYQNKSVFLMCKYPGKTWGNSVVYGALFQCADFDFYSRILDAYYACSMSNMLRNHMCDLHHRINVNVTPIHFKTLEELERLQYRETEPFTVQTYVGNPNHPKISQRLLKPQYRILDGLDVVNYKKLFWEVTNDKLNT